MNRTLLFKLMLITFFLTAFNFHSWAHETAQELYKQGLNFSRAGNYENAVSTFKKAIRLKPDYVEAYSDLGLAYDQLGRHEKALEAHRQAVRLRPNDPISLVNLGVCYDLLGRYEEGIKAFKRATRINPNLPEAYHNLGWAYGKIGNYKEEIEAYKKAIRIKPGFAQAHNNLGEAYLKIGKRDLALAEYKILSNLNPRLANELFQKIKRQEVKSPGDIFDLSAIIDDPDGYTNVRRKKSTSSDIVAKLYEGEKFFTFFQEGNWWQVKTLDGKVGYMHVSRIKIIEAKLDEAKALNKRTDQLYQAGRYQEGLVLARRAMQLNEKTLGPEHPNTAQSLNELARLYTAMGSHEKALPLFQRALKIREKALGPEHPDTAQSLNNLAALYQAQGKYDEAEPLLQRALKIWKKVLGPDHPATAISLSNLAALYNDMGAYGKALSLHQKALKIREKALGAKHPDTAISLSNLAWLYKAMGSYENAQPLHRRALMISEKALGPEHPYTAVSLSNLGALYQDMGAYGKALSLHQKALKIREKALGAKHPDTAQSLNNLAALHTVMGAYDDALPLYQRALKIFEKTLGSDHPLTVISLSNQGFLYLALNDYQNAETYFRRGRCKPGMVDLSLARGQPEEALKLLQDQTPTWRSSPLFLVQYYTQSGLALAGVGRLGEAALALRQAVEGVEELRRRAPGEKAGFFQAGIVGGYIRAFRGLVSVLGEMALKQEVMPPALKEYGSDAGAAAFYFAESTKGRVLLEAMALTARQKTRAEIPAKLRKKEESLSNRLAALEAQWEKALQGGEAAIKGIQNQKARLTTELKTLIRILREKHPVYAALHYPQPLPAADLPLKEDEVLLEYALGDKESFVFVVRQGGIRKLSKITLGLEELEAKVKTFMEPLINRQLNRFSQAQARELYELLLADVLAEVKKDDRAIIVPDGILGLLPFEALVINQGGGLQDSVFVGDVYNLSYYQSATVMALQRRLEEHKAKRKLFAIGNPVFNKTDSRYVAYKKGKESSLMLAQASPQAAFRALATRREWGKTSQDDQKGQELVYPPLFETEKEVKTIAQLLGVKPSPPDVLLNVQANETSLRKSPLEDYRYLHFATHADLPGNVQGIKEPFILLGQVENKKGDDGFLTMSEVLGLKLKADMVVLSACLTGRGKVMEGEGVANFARAFQHAGAESVVISLWEVASLPAVEYMIQFYGHLRDGKSRSEALKLARQAIKAKYPEPFFWAVFILHGEG